MAVGQYQSAVGIDHETGGLRRHIALGIERARLIDLDRHHAAGNALERGSPIRRRGLLRHRRVSVQPGRRRRQRR
jgi:hypothetical protein